MVRQKQNRTPITSAGKKTEKSESLSISGENVKCEIPTVLNNMLVPQKIK